jgi:hypothetical protein
MNFTTHTLHHIVCEFSCVGILLSSSSYKNVIMALLPLLAALLSPKVGELKCKWYSISISQLLVPSSWILSRFGKLINRCSKPFGPYCSVPIESYHAER